MKVLALEGSPRRGNSSMLLDWVLEGVREGGGEVTRLRVVELDIRPCTGCDSCLSTGECILVDDMAWLVERVMESWHLVLASPVYFYHLPAQLKAFIDRLQPLWVRRSLLHRDPPQRGGLLFLGVGATRGERLFEGILLTLKCVAPSLGLEVLEPLLVRGVDAPGEVARREDLAREARRRGRELLSMGPGPGL